MPTLSLRTVSVSTLRSPFSLQSPAAHCLDSHASHRLAAADAAHSPLDLEVLTRSQAAGGHRAGAQGVGAVQAGGNPERGARRRSGRG
jgi:hypothetical protein